MRTFVSGIVALCAAASTMAQGPVEALKSFSAFQQVDLHKLLNGEILTERGALMNFRNGISGQTCYAVPVSAAETVKRLQTWNPSSHTELKVYAWHAVHMPAELADFQQLDFKSSQRSIRWLLEKSSAKPELNLTREEAGMFATSRGDSTQVTEAWKKLLLNRATVFQQKGLAGTLPYEMTGGAVSPAAQLQAMLLEQTQMIREFSPLLKQIGLLGNGTGPSPASSYYWTFFDANHHGTLNLGAVYQLPVGDHFQLVDVQYFVSGDYYASVTLYEIWPVQVGEKSGALVWRGDYFAAPMLAVTKGAERIAYGVLMLQDIKKEIRCFQEGFKTK